MTRRPQPTARPDGRPEPRIDADVVDRFWRLVDFGESSACWPWLGLRRSGGYGVFNIDGRAEGAHRIAYKLGKRRWPRGLVVMHTCDNPPCCNPAHLKIGDTARNVEDMVAKGRHARGSRKPWAKLTEASVAAMRREAALLIEEMIASGEREYGAMSRASKVLAARHGIEYTLIYSAMTRRTWGHVP